MAISAVAGVLSVAGTVAGVVGSFMQYSAAQKAEKLRSKQAALEAARARREQVRRTQSARASAVAAAVNQGAGQTSALAGGIAQIQNTGGRNTVAINEDLAIGNGIYKANQQANLGGFIGNLGQGISSLGSVVSSQAGTITRLGQDDIPFAKKTGTYA